MSVVTVRLNDNISGFVNVLSCATNRSKSEVVRELLSRAVNEEKATYWLKKYGKREITMRRVARELGIPLWKVVEMVGENQPYTMADLQSDFRAINQ